MSGCRYTISGSPCLGTARCACQRPVQRCATDFGKRSLDRHRTASTQARDPDGGSAASYRPQLRGFPGEIRLCVDLGGDSSLPFAYVDFGTNARRRRGLSTSTLRIVVSFTPARRSFGTNCSSTEENPRPQFAFKWL